MLVVVLALPLMLVGWLVRCVMSVKALLIDFLVAN